MQFNIFLSRILLIVTIATYIISWFLPALTFYDGWKVITWNGWECFLHGIAFGWLGGNIEAFANFLFFPAVLLLWHKKWIGAGIVSDRPQFLVPI
jgi:hypothetical protein